MASRTTIKVRELVEHANHMLKNSTCSPAERKAVFSFTEHFLMLTNQYSGFCLLGQNEVPEGQLPGIIPGYDDNGDRDNTKNVYPDESRVQFFLKGK